MVALALNGSQSGLLAQPPVGGSGGNWREKPDMTMNSDFIATLRPGLTGYCYRMLGSVFEADDAVQETLLKAWHKWDQFRQESSRTRWVYRIATNVCIDKLRNSKRRALPMDLSDPAAEVAEPRDTLPLTEWVSPIPDGSVDPADLAERRAGIRIAFIAALQMLPPRQRAAVVLKDVFQWTAKETADALGTSTQGVNSALQRARQTMATANLRAEALRVADSEVDQELLDRYVSAFEAYDVDALMALFREDGSMSMPPFVMWIRGHAHLAAFYEATRSHCLGSRLLPASMNGGLPAFAQYAPTGADGVLEPWGVHVLEVADGKIAHIHTFIDSRLYPRLGLPVRLEPDGEFPLTDDFVGQRSS